MALNPRRIGRPVLNDPDPDLPVPVFASNPPGVGPPALIEPTVNSEHKTRPAFRVTADIPRGGRIYTEIPVVRLPKGYDSSSLKQTFDIVRALPDNEADDFDWMCGFSTLADKDRASRRCFPIWRSLEAEEKRILACRQGLLRDGSICMASSFIDVSYSPNSAGSWNENLGRFTVHALRDIPAGTTLSMAHQNLDCCSAETQLWLIDRHSGTGCVCSQCETHGYGAHFWATKRTGVELDRMLREANALGEERDWAKCWDTAEKLVAVQNIFGDSVELNCALELAVQYNWALFYLDQTAFYLYRYIACQEILVGRDHPRYEAAQAFLATLQEISEFHRTFVRMYHQITLRTDEEIAWANDQRNLRRRIWCAEKEVMRERRLGRGSEYIVLGLEAELEAYKANINYEETGNDQKWEELSVGLRLA